LQSTITGMAQDFVGSNNINLLEPRGQFGTRMAGGKDAASPRYIFTRLSPVTRLLFPDVDDSLLQHLEDDGVLIEPKFYCPIIPLLLVNGAQGIGTGWSTYIPQYHTIDILEHVRAKLDQKDTLPIIRPWARGFTGIIEEKEDGKGYRSTGIAKKRSKASVVISELPVGKWTNDYKKHLIAMQSKGEIESFVENHTTSSASFIVTMKSVQLNRMMKTGLEKVFKLQSSLPLTNMHAFDANSSIQKYTSPEDVVAEYFPIRLSLYHDRKGVLERSKEYSTTLARNKARFIETVVDGKIDLMNGRNTKIDTINTLQHLNFDQTTELEKILIRSNLGEKDENNEESNEKSDEENGLDESDDNLKGYDYLLNMPLSSLTSERIDSLRNEADKTEMELVDVKNATPEMLWHEDLDRLNDYLRKTKH